MLFNPALPAEAATAMEPVLRKRTYECFLPRANASQAHRSAAVAAQNGHVWFAGGR
jgi:hypothetical protein